MAHPDTVTTGKASVSRPGKGPTYPEPVAHEHFGPDVELQPMLPDDPHVRRWDVEYTRKLHTTLEETGISATEHQRPLPDPPDVEVGDKRANDSGTGR